VPFIERNGKLLDPVEAIAEQSTASGIVVGTQIVTRDVRRVISYADEAGHARALSPAKIDRDGPRGWSELLVGIRLEYPRHAHRHGPGLSNPFQHLVMGLRAVDLRIAACSERYRDGAYAGLLGGGVVLQQPGGDILQIGCIASN
jgi:hypothetical protein